jgi:predicted RNase H-like HicB family nuclease
MTAVTTKSRRYSVVLVPDPDEGGYVVEVPALPGLVTYGRTMDEALEMARDAIQGWIEVQEETGRPVPAETEPVQVVSLVV